jgi:putative Mg2+ transporter-C (MgtC) family protein
MASIWTDIGLALPDASVILRDLARLLIAGLLSGVLGYNRAATGHAAGIRTHMLVGLGAAVFTLVPFKAHAMPSDLAEIVKGIATGVGFLGAGTILKLTANHEIRGLTTAASIWLTSAIGFSVAAGRVWLAILATALGWGVLSILTEIPSRGGEPHRP